MTEYPLVDLISDSLIGQQSIYLPENVDALHAEKKKKLAKAFKKRSLQPSVSNTGKFLWTTWKTMMRTMMTSVLIVR